MNNILYLTIFISTYIYLSLANELLSSKCITGEQHCVSECQCGYGYYMCSNNFWYYSDVPDSTICVQNATSIYLESTLNTASIGKVCGNKYRECQKCEGTYQKCDKECNCYSGYYECKNGMVKYRNADDRICKQINENSIKLVLPDNTRECPKTTGECQITGFNSSCVDFSERCVSPCECGSGYQLCLNNFWITIPLVDQVCTVNKSNSSLIVIIDIDNSTAVNSQCPNGLNGTCSPTTTSKSTTYTTTSTTTFTTTPTPTQTTTTTSIPSTTNETPTVQPCTNGDQLCENECNCGSGIYTCANGNYVLTPLSPDLICEQNNNKINVVPSCSIYGDQGKCSGRVTGSCGCVNNTCTNGQYQCISECECGIGYEKCVNNQWELFPIPNQSVCSYDSTKGNITFVSSCPEYGDQGKCSGVTFGQCSCAGQCNEGDMKCNDQCTCKGTFSECNNGVFITQQVPANTVCYQENSTSIAFYHSCQEYGDQGKCSGQINGNCNCNIEPVCTEGEQQCINECQCDGKYRTCEGGEWIIESLPYGTICAQNGSSISLEYGCSELGPAELCKDKIKNCNCSDFEQCQHGEQKCINECNCFSGYLQCDHGKWIERPIANGNICQQTGTSIRQVFACSIYGDQGTCSGKTTGNCRCPDNCYEHEQHCSESCTCGKGFYECIDGKNTYTPISVNEICEQISLNSVYVLDTTKTSEYGICNGKAKGSCIRNDNSCSAPGTFCTNPCQIGGAIKICDQINSIPEYMDISNLTICEQYKIHSVRLLPENDVICCTQPIKCSMPGSYCINECIPGAGFYTCDGQNNIVESDIPDNMICRQTTHNDIQLFSVHSTTSAECHQKIKQCGHHKHDHKPKETSHLLTKFLTKDNYNDGVELHIRNTLNNNPYEREISCTLGDGTYCNNQCGDQYYICNNQFKYDAYVPKGLLCYQKSSNNIELVHLKDPKCSEINISADQEVKQEDTIKTSPTEQPKIFKCPPKDGMYCSNECSPNNGYYHCTSGKSVYINPPANTICWQSDDNVVQFVHSDPVKGNQFGCTGRLKI